MSPSAARVARIVLPLLVVSCGSSSAPQAASPSFARSAATALAATARVDGATNRDETLTREPMILEHPSGVLLVAGYGYRIGEVSLWKSADRGATWTRVSFGPDGAGLIGDSDVDLAVAPDGTIYLASLTFSRDTNEGTQLAMATSRDVGATWTWTLVSRHRYDDRPWVKVAPDGTAHVIWNDGEGVNHAVSHDRGATWQRLARIHEAGGSSHFAIGPHGEIAARVVPLCASGNKIAERVDLVAVSTDGGQTWAKHPAPGVRAWSLDDSAFPRWVEPLAWDAAGTLYSLSGDEAGLTLARSSDRGERWQSWRIASGRSFYPYLAAGASGDLAASWYGGEGATLAWNVARIQVAADASAPRVLAAPPRQTECFDKKMGRSTCGEYQPVALLRDGSVGGATTIQNYGDQRFGFTWWRLEAR